MTKREPNPKPWPLDKTITGSSLAHVREVAVGPLPESWIRPRYSGEAQAMYAQLEQAREVPPRLRNEFARAIEQLQNWERKSGEHLSHDDPRYQAQAEQFKEAIAHAKDALPVRNASSTFLHSLSSVPAPGEEVGGEPAWHNEDYTSVVWYGTSYSFNKGQAECVRVLWEAWQKGVPNLSAARIGDEIEAATDDFRLSSRFRNRVGGHHSAWGSMIQRVDKGIYALKEPDPG